MTSTVWSIFPGDTEYWPREQQVMVNYRVSDLDAMLAQLRAAGAEVDDKVEEHEFGRFAGRSTRKATASSSGSRLVGREQGCVRAAARDDPAVVAAEPVGTLSVTVVTPSGT